MPILNNQKIDRRVSRTRRHLQEAMLALILEKGYDSVTVEEITARADLGRTTFYLHYHDKEDLLMQSARNLVDGLVTKLAQYPMDRLKLHSDPTSGDMLLPIVALAFQHVEQNADLYRVVLRGEGTYSAVRRVRQILNQAIADLIQQIAARNKLEFNPQVPMNVFINSLAGAWIGMITWWLDEDLPYPPEQMAIMYQRMFMRSIREVLGPTPAPETDK